MSNLTRCQNTNVLFIQFFPVTFSSWTGQLFQPTLERFTHTAEFLKILMFILIASGVPDANSPPREK